MISRIIEGVYQLGSNVGHLITTAKPMLELNLLKFEICERTAFDNISAAAIAEELPRRRGDPLSVLHASQPDYPILSQLPDSSGIELIPRRHIRVLRLRGFHAQGTPLSRQKILVLYGFCEHFPKSIRYGVGTTVGNQGRRDGTVSRKSE